MATTIYEPIDHFIIPHPEEDHGPKRKYVYKVPYGNGEWWSAGVVEFRHHFPISAHELTNYQQAANIRQERERQERERQERRRQERERELEREIQVKEEELERIRQDRERQAREIQVLNDSLESEKEEGIRKDKEKQEELHKQSRYKEEFKEVEEIGKGGFGRVFKVYRKLDEKYYAVKKIKLKLAQSDHSIEEVKISAKFTHPNVVRYYNAWIEKTSDGNFGENGSSDTGGIIFDNNASLPSAGSSATSAGSSATSAGSSATSAGSSATLAGSSATSAGSSATSAASSVTSAASSAMSAVGGTQVLYMQMELCSGTLKEWLEKRNSDLASSSLSDSFAVVNESDNEKIFKGILNGLQHIHSKGVIHRDLWSGNIFIEDDLQVKIGDFGFSKSENGADPPTASGQSIEPTSSSQSIDRDPSSRTPDAGNSSQEHLESDKKSDMSSVAVILFELLRPFGKGERKKFVGKLLKEKESKEIRERWPKQEEVIKDLLQSDKNKIPLAEDVYNKLFPKDKVGDQVKAMSMNAEPDAEEGERYHVDERKKAMEKDE